MTKEVMVSIKGLQFDQSADSEEIETIQWGQYYKKNGTHSVSYTHPTLPTNSRV